MRVVLLGLSLLSILNIVVAVQPVNVDLILETTDDEDLIWLLKNRRRRSIEDDATRIAQQKADSGVTNEVISGLDRRRRDVDLATGAGVAGTGAGTNQDGAGGTANSSSNGGNDPLDMDYSGGSGGGSGDGADYDADTNAPIDT